MFKGLDHLAIVVPDTDSALAVWRDRFGFPVLFSEVVNDGAARLTHLDLGNTQLQLVEPLKEGPLSRWLDENGPGLHHFCLSVENVDEALEEAPKQGLPSGQAQPHQGTRGKRALFLDRMATGGIAVELTGR